MSIEYDKQKINLAVIIIVNFHILILSVFGWMMVVQALKHLIQYEK